MSIKFFISGTMKGSIISKGLYPQNYRTQLSELIKKIHPDSEVVGYDELYPGGVENEKEEEAFYELIKQAGNCDVMIAFIPEASMGTAIELWEAHKNKKVILTVSPLIRNWTVRFISSYLFNNIESLELFLQKGEINKLI